MKVELRKFLEELRTLILGGKKGNKSKGGDLEDKKQNEEQKHTEEELPSIYKFDILGLGIKYIDYYHSTSVGEFLMTWANCDKQIREIMGVRTPDGKIKEILTGICYDEVKIGKKASQLEIPCGVYAGYPYLYKTDFSKTYEGLCKIGQYINNHPNKEKYAKELEEDFAEFPKTRSEEIDKRSAFIAKRAEIIRMLDRKDN